MRAWLLGLLRLLTPRRRSWRETWHARVPFPPPHIARRWDCNERERWEREGR